MFQKSKMGFGFQSVSLDLCMTSSFWGISEISFLVSGFFPVFTRKLEQTVYPNRVGFCL